MSACTCGTARTPLEAMVVATAYAVMVEVVEAVSVSDAVSVAYVVADTVLWDSAPKMCIDAHLEPPSLTTTSGEYIRALPVDHPHSNAWWLMRWTIQSSGC